MYIPRITTQVIASINALKRITSTGDNDDNTPLVFWHGMGDSYNSESMERAISLVETHSPGKAVYSVFVDVDDSKDQRGSLIGNVNEQLEYVCDQLWDIEELTSGFDFIGFSQGGLFARAAIERCALPVRNLVTFGSPHAGISDLPRCADGNWLCKKRNAVLKRQVWRDSIQKSVVSAQYFRDPVQYDQYLEHSAFLSDVNNEKGAINASYVNNLSTLEKLVLIRFVQDETLVPKDSAWFHDVDEDGTNYTFNETMFYANDLLGLKGLSEDGKIEFLEINDRHMAIPDEFLLNVLDNYLSPKKERSIM